MSALHGESVFTLPAKAGVAIALLPSRRAPGEAGAGAFGVGGDRRRSRRLRRRWRRRWRSALGEGGTGQNANSQEDQTVEWHRQAFPRAHDETRAAES